MNLVLLLPAALAALAALALPLLVHLARRQQERPTVFAALRWLRAQPRPRRRVRFDEWPLLLVRLLLVALVALLLAQPSLLGVEDARPRLLVVPGVDEAAIREARERSGDDVDARWLATGFPDLDLPAPVDTSATASLLREFDASLPAAAPLTVVVPDTLDGADAARLRLAREVGWRIVAAPSPRRETARLAPPVVAIRHDAAHRGNVRFLRAAALAWQVDEAGVTADADAAAGQEPPAAEAGADGAPRGRGTVDVSVEADTDVPADAQVLAWLHAGEVPAGVLGWVERGGQLLLPQDATAPASSATAAVWRDAEGGPLVNASALGNGRVLQFVRPLRPAAMPALVEPGFAAELRDLLQPPSAPTRVAAPDYAPDTGAVAAPAPARALHAWLALAIALLALVERWLATSRRRRAVA